MARPARKREKLEQPVCVGDVLASVLQGLGAWEGRARLALLWQHWETVMGPELGPLAQPLGGRNGVLLVGAEDGVLAQELQFRSGEILERANAFLEQAFFSAVRISLLRGRQPLCRREPLFAEQGWRAPRRRAYEPPHAHGIHLDKMDPASVVARAYARFVDLSGRGEPG